MLRWSFALLILLHALIHLLGFAKAFGFAELAQLTQPISRGAGLGWLAACVALLIAVVTFAAQTRGFWAVGALAVLLSQAMILQSFADAKWGTLPNLLLLLVVAYAFRVQGPFGFRAAYQREALLGEQPASGAASAPVITEADLAQLPAPVQRYLRVTGVLGQPRAKSFRLRFKGRMRAAPREPWMPFTAVQQSFAEPPTRLFLMDATMKGLPVQAYHRYAADGASFRVRVAGYFDMVNVTGPELVRAETVTVLNDMCLLAPGMLLSPRMRWESLDETSARVYFSVGIDIVSATLFFDQAGYLTNFVSDDRTRLEPDGKTMNQVRFSTPVRDYRTYGPVKLMSYGEARWHAAPPEGEFTYGEFELVELTYGG
jgi:hypothetical protein